MVPLETSASLNMGKDVVKEGKDISLAVLEDLVILLQEQPDFFDGKSTLISGRNWPQS